MYEDIEEKGTRATMTMVMIMSSFCHLDNHGKSQFPSVGCGVELAVTRDIDFLLPFEVLFCQALILLLRHHLLVFNISFFIAYYCVGYFYFLVSLKYWTFQWGYWNGNQCSFLLARVDLYLLRTVFCDLHG